MNDDNLPELPSLPDLSDRRNWGAGPWQQEFDIYKWRFKGVPCIIKRNPVGALCGYAGVPPGHPWHGKHYDDVDASVHGGLTFSEGCHGDICHQPEPGESDDVWWLGFDCSHGGDLSPQMNAFEAMFMKWEPRGTYKDSAWVKAETERLVEQALAVQP